MRISRDKVNVLAKRPHVRVRHVQLVSSGFRGVFQEPADVGLRICVETLRPCDGVRDLRPAPAARSEHVFDEQHGEEDDREDDDDVDREAFDGDRDPGHDHDEQEEPRQKLVRDPVRKSGRGAAKPLGHQPASRGRDSTR